MILLADRVMILPDAAEKETSAGLILPEVVAEKQMPYKKGTVTLVGNGTRDEPMVFEEGDRVLYHKEAGAEIEWNDVKYLLIRSADIYATIEEDVNV